MKDRGRVRVRTGIADVNVTYLRLLSTKRIITLAMAALSYVGLALLQ